jgi:Outer membrane lipoprotein-sorting protein
MRYLVLALLVIVNGAAAADPSAQEIVSATDKVRNPGKPFRLTSTLTEYVAGKPRDRVVLVVYAKEDPATRQFKNLVRYVDPPRDRGKMVLLDGTRMWFYDPASKVSIRISAQQRLMGQASNGDVMTVNLARDYRATLAGEEAVTDADRQARECWHLVLAAATEDAVYSKIDYWVERSSNRPVKGKYYSDSGRLLKIAYFRAFREELGAARPTETIIIDAVDPNQVTTLNSSDYRFETIPEAWFQREFLPRLKVE